MAAETIQAILIGVVIAVVILLAVWWVFIVPKSDQAVINADVKWANQQIQQKAAQCPRKCGTCVMFDLEEGQAAIRQNPVFFQAVQHVSPNTMMRKFDDNGAPIENPKALKIKEDNWQLFGACELHQQLRHSTDSCEQWTCIVEKKPEAEELS